MKNTLEKLKKLGNYLLCAAPLIGDLNIYRVMARNIGSKKVPAIISTSIGAPKALAFYAMISSPYGILGIIPFVYFSIIEAMALKNEKYS